MKPPAASVCVCSAAWRSPTAMTRGHSAFHAQGRRAARCRRDEPGTACDPRAARGAAWGSCTDQQARQSLRQALALLRKELRWPHFLSTDTEVVRLQPGCWSIDARELEAAVEILRSGRARPRRPPVRRRFPLRARTSRRKASRNGCASSASACSWPRRGCARRSWRAPTSWSMARRRWTSAEQLLAIDPLREDWQRIALTLYARYRGTQRSAGAGGSLRGVCSASSAAGRSARRRTWSSASARRACRRQRGRPSARLCRRMSWPPRPAWSRPPHGRDRCAGAAIAAALAVVAARGGGRSR